MNWTQLGMMGLLIEAEGNELTLKQLEKGLNISQSVIARMAIYLTENGYTEYTKNTDDKRVKKIYLLEKGFQYYNEIFVSMNEEEQPMLEGMSLGEKILFQELLQKVLLNSIKVQQEMKNNQKRL
ncbi:MAG: hypothetical protein HFE57_10975 [Firmicutes bacterium]|nr:hypothetical protein [Bacillota bacterium]